MQYVIANFKSHKTTAEVEAWLKAYTPASPQGIQVILALSFPYLHLLSPTNTEGHKLTLAAQDVSPFPAGSYTGAVNATQLQDLGVKYCLVGHSERRRYFHETPVEVGNKVDNLLASGITPIICVSEPDFAPQFAALEASFIPRCLFAYETPADIGGEETTPVTQIQAAISRLRAYAQPRCLGLLYGGSVNPGNVKSLIGVVDGLLVATASQDPSSFAQVIEGFSSNA